MFVCIKKETGVKNALNCHYSIFEISVSLDIIIGNLA
jgi:hypothetical protein